jgi:hypothetical protein
VSVAAPSLRSSRASACFLSSRSSTARRSSMPSLFMATTPSPSDEASNVDLAIAWRKLAPSTIPYKPYWPFPPGRRPNRSAHIEAHLVNLFKIRCIARCSWLPTSMAEHLQIYPRCCRHFCCRRLGLVRRGNQDERYGVGLACCLFATGSIKCFQDAAFGVRQLRVVVVNDAVWAKRQISHADARGLAAAVSNRSSGPLADPLSERNERARPPSRSACDCSESASLCKRYGAHNRHQRVVVYGS